MELKNGVINNQGLNETLNKLRNEIKETKDPICTTADTQCCKPENIKLIADSFFGIIAKKSTSTGEFIIITGENKDSKIDISMIKNMGFYLPLMSIVQEIYSIYMNEKNSENNDDINFEEKNIPEKKVYLKYLMENYKNRIDESTINEVNVELNKVNDTNDTHLNNLFNKMLESLNSTTNKSNSNSDEIKKKIKFLEDTAIDYAKQEDSVYEPGNTKTKKLINWILFNSLCNIFSVNEAGETMIKEAGGINNVIDLIKSSSAAGSIISFFYIITVIILILCGFFGVF